MSASSWNVTLQFSAAYALFALSFYASLSVGVLSVASVASGAVGGFLFAGLVSPTGGNAVAYLFLGAASGGVLAFIVSIFLLRLSSHFIAFATISLILVTNVVVLNIGPTGGVAGKVVPGPFGWPHLLITLAVCSWIFHRLQRSRLGLAAAVIREDPLVGSVLGINPRSVQRLGFVLAGIVGGVGGVLLAGLLRYIDPSTYYLPLAFTALAAVVLGSAYHWQGAIIGAVVFTVLPQVLSDYLSTDFDQVVNGVLIVVIIIFLPGGLWDIRRFATRAWRRPSVLEPGPLIARVAGGEQLVTLTGGQGAHDGVLDGAHELVEAIEDHVPGHHAEPVPAAPLAAAIEVDALSRSFGGIRAVHELSFSVPRDLIFGIVGPNGAGKTTVINLLSGVYAPDGGAITVLDETVTGWAPHRIARLGVARTYQNIRLSPGMSTLDTIMAGAYARGHSNVLSIVAAMPSERRERRGFAEEARDLMDRVGITTPPERVAQTLAYGEQRRVEIARALASKPKVLLLDEPTAGMNARESAALGDLCRELVATGLTIVLIEHNMRLVSEYCDTALVMHLGELLAEGRPRECLARDDVQAAYFGRRTDAARIQALRGVRLN
jgi:branched-chain amino acid transport system ATP-binding protein